MLTREQLIVVVFCALLPTMVRTLQCRDGFFVRSDVFDVDRSSPEPTTCPSTAEAGCVRFEVEGSFTTSGQQVPFTFWMTSCGSVQNCTADCTDELDGQMMRVLRSVGRDDDITVSATCETACCAGDDCNSASVSDIKEAGQLVATDADDTDGNLLIVAVGSIKDAIKDGLGGSASTPSRFSYFQTLILLSVVFLCFM